MIYLRTRLATNWQQGGSTIGVRIAQFVLKLIPKANPDYEGKMHLVKEWLIEFDDDGKPWREIGMDDSGRPVLAGPSIRNYGFWLDTNMIASDFHGEKLDRNEFEKNWKACGVHVPD